MVGHLNDCEYIYIYDVNKYYRDIINQQPLGGWAPKKNIIRQGGAPFFLGSQFGDRFPWLTVGCMIGITSELMGAPLFFRHLPWLLSQPKQNESLEMTSRTQGIWTLKNLWSQQPGHGLEHQHQLAEGCWNHAKYQLSSLSVIQWWKYKSTCSDPFRKYAQQTAHSAILPLSQNIRTTQWLCDNYVEV